eukprot:CAMPEP_0119305246 /NCGR_PEP_ID=MMETSP1333-20130426/6289_1 /TAXON_ID=418940 /ORGANISM="Scyphosphaera apsteinii, Strain RCC1455" /LENGTH=98 /DNA_ID=CAMNT_0007308291 /DNA_START=402 /DNA_END=699 /DNA_ORIENTATION=-
MYSPQPYCTTPAEPIERHAKLAVLPAHAVSSAASATAAALRGGGPAKDEGCCATSPTLREVLVGSSKPKGVSRTRLEVTLRTPAVLFSNFASDLRPGR